MHVFTEVPHYYCLAQSAGQQIRNRKRPSRRTCAHRGSAFLFAGMFNTRTGCVLPGFLEPNRITRTGTNQLPGPDRTGPEFKKNRTGLPGPEFSQNITRTGLTGPEAKQNPDRTGPEGKNIRTGPDYPDRTGHMQKLIFLLATSCHP